MFNDKPIQEGDRVGTCSGVAGSFNARRGRHTEKSYSQWTGVVYVAKARKKDGVITYRRTSEVFGPIFSGPTPTPDFVEQLKKACRCRWVDKVIQNKPVDDMRNLTADFSSIFYYEDSK